MKYSVCLRSICRLVNVMLMIAVFCCLAACNVTKDVPADSSADKKVPAADFSPVEISFTKVCGKCSMFPAKFPQWQSQVVFTDGSMIPFDGCKCMFNYLLDMGKYSKTHTRSDVARVWVKDFNTGTWLDADSAVFVIGSSVMGPMGKQLIPFAEQAAADSFQKKNGGSIGRYSEINMETLMPLSMDKMKMKM